MAEPISGPGWLADQFEHWRPHLASVAYGMLGSVSEAEDAVQQAWLRLGRSDAGAIVDLRAWLTTVVGRICLDMLRGAPGPPGGPPWSTARPGCCSARGTSRSRC